MLSSISFVTTFAHAQPDFRWPSNTSFSANLIMQFIFAQLIYTHLTFTFTRSFCPHPSVHSGDYMEECTGKSIPDSRFDVHGEVRGDGQSSADGWLASQRRSRKYHANALKTHPFVVVGSIRTTMQRPCPLQWPPTRHHPHICHCIPIHSLHKEPTYLQLNYFYLFTSPRRLNPAVDMSLKRGAC